MSPPLRIRRNRGFTLLEILITIAICAALASLLFMATKSASQAVNTTKCLGNLRQIGTLASAYSNDNNGRVLTHHVAPDSSVADDSAYWWPQILVPYLGNGPFKHSVSGRNRLLELLCPADPYASPNRTKSWNGSYAMFGSPGGRITRGEINNPSKKIYIGDSPWNGERKAWNGSASREISSSDNDIRDPQGIVFRHGGKANFLFHDGHVGSFTPQDLPLPPRVTTSSTEYRETFDWLY